MSRMTTVPLDLATEPNIEKMMEFLQYERIRIPSWGVSWPLDVINLFGEDPELEYTKLHQVVQFSPNKLRIAAAPSTYLRNRIFFVLLDEASRKIKRLSARTALVHRSSLIRRLYHLDFLQHLTFRD